MAEQAAAQETKPVTNGASNRPTREAMIAELDKLTAGGDAKPVEAKPANDNEPAKEPEAVVEADEDPDEDPEPEDDDSAAAAKDPDLAKRLAIVAKQEKRARERETQAKAAIEQERAAIKREREELQSSRGELEAFAKLKGRVKYDALGVMKALGLSEEDLGLAARQLWAHSKEGSADPKVSKEAASRLMKEREAEDRIARLERELEEQKKAEQERAQSTQIQQKVEAYLAGIQKAVTGEHPLARRLIEKQPNKAALKFGEIAQRLADRDGDLPDAEDVLAEYERTRREELEADGVDVAAMLKTAKPKPKADEQTRTLGNDIGTSTAAKPSGGARKTMQEKRAELERELRTMDLKGR